MPPDITFNDRLTLTLGGRRFDDDLCRPGTFGERHDDDGRAGRRAVRRRYRAEQPHPLHEQRRRQYQAVARRVRRGGEARPEIHHSRSRPAVDRSQEGDRLHPRLYRLSCARRWRKAVEELDRFRRRLSSRPTGRNTADIPAFEANNRGNAYRIYLELEQSQFGGAKP